MIETKISLDYEGVLELGRTGEEEARCFIFDLTDWMEHFAEGGKVSLLARRSWEQASYPCSIATDGNTAVWTVRSGDVAVPGKNGCVELRYEVGGSVVLSKVWPTEVGESLVEPSGPAPDPAQPWVDEVLQAADRAEFAADEAAEACGIFVAEYGKTTWAELKTAYDAEKTLVCRYDEGARCYSAPMTYAYLGTGEGTQLFEFRRPSGSYEYTYTLKDTGSWSSTAWYMGNSYASRTHTHTPESIGAISAVGRSLLARDNIDEMHDHSYVNAGSTAIKNGLGGDLPFPSSFNLTIEQHSPNMNRTVQVARNLSTTSPKKKWRHWNGTTWSVWVED